MSSLEGRRIRLVISENVPFQHDSFVKGLAVYGDIDIVGEAWDPDEALEVVNRLKPDVVLYDLQYTGWDQETAYNAIRAMRRGSATTRILAFTAYPDLAEEVRKVGCDRIMLKESGIGIKQVHSAIVALGSEPGETVKVTWEQIGATAAEVAAFMAYVQTGTKKGAAALRDLDESTQKNQEQTLRDKLESFTGEDVSNMSKAITLAFRLGLIDRKDLERHDAASQ